MNRIFTVVLGLLLASPSLVAQVPYFIVVAESNAGSLGGNTAAYGGLQQYHFTASGSPAAPGAGLAAAQVNDPVGVVLHNNQLFVSNRIGNTIGQGSVQRINVTAGVTMSGGPVIATASNAAFQGFHGFAFSPANQDLFVTTASGGTRRYRDSGGGYSDIGGVASGAVRGVALSPDGTKMYESAGGTIRVTDVLANSFGATTIFPVSGASGIHQLTLHNGSLYAADFNSSQVFQIQLNASFVPVSSSSVASSAGAIGVGFSPDGQEMYVPGHTSNQIGRFLLSSGNWVANGTISTGHNMGYIAVVPVPEPALALAGVAGFIVFRRWTHQSHSL